jgi:hypothetical protein
MVAVLAEAEAPGAPVEGACTDTTISMNDATARRTPPPTTRRFERFTKLLLNGVTGVTTLASGFHDATHH